MAPQLTATKGPDARWQAMHRAGDELLARSALAGDEHRDVEAGDALDQTVHLTHRRAVAEHVARGLQALQGRFRRVGAGV
jgi:hypothetical protein